MRPATISLPEARRIALAAQGFAERRPVGRVDRRHLRRVIDRIGLLQIDSVNVVVRSHYLPLFSRLGAYDRSWLATTAYGAPRELFEYWGHEASLLPVEVQPLLRWRMTRARDAFETWGALARLARERPGYIAAVLAEVRDRGPLTPGELREPGTRAQGNWGWNRTDGKIALEWLFWTGQVSAASRRSFERVYDVTERVLPPAVLTAPTPTEKEAHRALLLRAAGHLGVATGGDLADYYRIKRPEARPRLAELVDAGALLPVTVAGWRQPAYLAPDARLPRRVHARALLSPFDSLVWERDRTQRLFGFRYRIEIYTPAHKRVHGYYVLPFLLGDRLVARVDLKADRAAGVLRVVAAYVEADAPPDTAIELAGELTSMAAWLGLGDVAVGDRGDLAALLGAALHRGEAGAG